MKLLAFDPLTTTQTLEDAERVLAIARRAAEGLTSYCARPARVTLSRDRRVASAVAAGEYRLVVSVGEYAAIGRRPWREDVREWIARRDAAPRVRAFDVLAEAEWLLDGEMADQGSFGNEYANPEFASVEDAIAWVREHCLRAPLDRITAVDLAEWRRRQVLVPDAKDLTKKVAVSLVEAVRVYGPVYRRSITLEKLVENHGIASIDAQAIVDAVLRLVPAPLEMAT